MSAARPGILMVGNFLTPGGSRQPCVDLALQLESAGWDVCRTSRYQTRALRLADMVASVFRWKSRYQVAQVDLFSGASFLWAESVAAALRSVRRPMVLTLHGGALPEFAERWPRRVARLMGWASVVTTPSSFLADRMRPFRSEIEVVPNALDIESYPFRKRVSPAARLVWLRAFHSIYQPWLAPRVLQAVRRDLHEASLTMSGPDKLDGSLQRVESEIIESDLKGSVSLPGQVAKDQVAERLNQGNIFLNTSSVDNTPVSLIEAMACGLCVVSFSVGGIPYLVNHGEEALLVPDKDTEGMANAVRRILEEEGLAEHLSTSARRLAEQFDWSVVLPKWKQILAEVVENG